MSNELDSNVIAPIILVAKEIVGICARHISSSSPDISIYDTNSVSVSSRALTRAKRLVAHLTGRVDPALTSSVHSPIERTSDYV